MPVPGDYVRFLSPKPSLSLVATLLRTRLKSFHLSIVKIEYQSQSPQRSLFTHNYSLSHLLLLARRILA